MEVVYSSHEDFLQRFLFGHSVKEHFLKLLGSMMNDIEHNFIDNVFAERMEGCSSGVDQSWIRRRVSVITCKRLLGPSLFTKKVQPTADAIDACIESLKKEVAELEACLERLFFGIVGSSHFEDQTLISGL